MPKKIPISVLILLHDNAGNILLLNRLQPDGFWQSVTGSLDAPSEPPFQAALRQLRDWHCSVEYEIYPHWRYRYPAGITRNTEHWFSAQIPADSLPTLSEHSAYQWLPALQAAEKVFSPSNREIILQWFADFQAA